MSQYPKLQLSKLRDIGWDKWDPIDLQHIDAQWRADGGDDEYASYLLHVVSAIRRGGSDAEAIDYLTSIESEHMGMGASATIRSRAADTVRAIRTYLAQFQEVALDGR